MRGELPDLLLGSSGRLRAFGMIADIRSHQMTILDKILIIVEKLKTRQASNQNST